MGSIVPTRPWRILGSINGTPLIAHLNSWPSKKDIGWRQFDHIARPTNKSRGRHTAYIPLLPEARELVDDIERRAETVLTTTRGSPWSPDGKGLSHAISAAAKKSNVDRNTHDLRRTFATKLAVGGVDDRTIAEIMGWSIDSVSRLRRIYVDRSAVVVSITERLANNSSNGSI